MPSAMPKFAFARMSLTFELENFAIFLERLVRRLVGKLHRRDELFPLRPL
jgi:hypothetical protein